MAATEQAVQVAARLSAVLLEEIASLRMAIGHLQAERQALEAGDADNLPVLAARKSEVYGRLAQLGDARNILLGRAGIADGNKDNINALFASGNEWMVCRQNFADLLQLARQAHELNHANGLLIRAQMRSSQQALAVLMSAAEQASVYGPDGQATARTSRRSFGSA